MEDRNYLLLFIDDKYYSQRTSNSKIIEIDKKGNILKKYNNYEELPFTVQLEIDKTIDLIEYPQKYFEYEIKKDQTLIIKSAEKIYDDKIKCVVIPEYINGYLVTELNEKLFSIMPNITTLTMPDSITEIGYSICDRCKELVNVRLSKNITRIPSAAFFFCTQLQKINFPPKLESICKESFSYSGLQGTITLPDTLKYIDGFTFSSCFVDTVNISKNTTYYSDCFELDTLINVYDKYQDHNLAK